MGGEGRNKKYNNGKVSCIYVASVDVGGAYGPFDFEKIAGHLENEDQKHSPVHKVCQSLHDRRVNITWDPERKPWSPKSPAECYTEHGAAKQSGHAVLLHVARSFSACKGDGTKEGCTDDYCNKDVQFEHYGVEKCRDQFTNALRQQCYGKGFGEDKPGEHTWNSFGGSYYVDCLSWTIVSAAPGQIPNETFSLNIDSAEAEEMVFVF